MTIIFDAATTERVYKAHELLAQIIIDHIHEPVAHGGGPAYFNSVLSYAAQALTNLDIDNYNLAGGHLSMVKSAITQSTRGHMIQRDPILKLIVEASDLSTRLFVATKVATTKEDLNLNSVFKEISDFAYTNHPIYTTP